MQNNTHRIIATDNLVARAIGQSLGIARFSLRAILTIQHDANGVSTADNLEPSAVIQNFGIAGFSIIPFITFFAIQHDTHGIFSTYNFIAATIGQSYGIARFSIVTIIAFVTFISLSPSYTRKAIIPLFSIIHNTYRISTTFYFVARTIVQFFHGTRDWGLSS